VKQDRDAPTAVATRLESALLRARSLTWRLFQRIWTVSPVSYGAQIQANSDTREIQANSDTREIQTSSDTCGLSVEPQEDIEPGYVDAAGIWRPLF
jgi:hypothetical protein